MTRRRRPLILPEHILPEPPRSRSENQATGYHGPTGDVMNPEAIGLVAALRAMYPTVTSEASDDDDDPDPR